MSTDSIYSRRYPLELGLLCDSPDAAEAEAFALAAIDMLRYREYDQAVALFRRALEFAKSAA